MTITSTLPTDIRPPDARQPAPPAPRTPPPTTGSATAQGFRQILQDPAASTPSPAPDRVGDGVAPGASGDGRLAQVPGFPLPLILEFKGPGTREAQLDALHAFTKDKSPVLRAQRLMELLQYGSGLVTKDYKAVYDPKTGMVSLADAGDGTTGPRAGRPIRSAEWINMATLIRTANIPQSLINENPAYFKLLTTARDNGGRVPESMLDPQRWGR